MIPFRLMAGRLFLTQVTGVRLSQREFTSASSNGRTSASDAEDVSSILSAGTSAEPAPPSALTPAGSLTLYESVTLLSLTAVVSKCNKYTTMTV